MLYDVKLVSFNSDEIIMIDLCMKLLNYDAATAYDCIDNMPSVIMSGVDMNAVKDIKAAFESEGAIIEVAPQSKNEDNQSSNQSSSLKESDLEILNLKYNPYENNKSSDDLLGGINNITSSNDTIARMQDDDNMREKRSLKYGRRSTDIDPKSVNYGRRSTDANPMIYNQQDEEIPDYNNINYNTDLPNMQSSYTDEIDRIKSIMPYEENFAANINKSSYESLDNDDAMLSEFGNTIIEKNNYNKDVRKDKDLNSKSPYGGLKKDNVGTGYKTLRKDSSLTGYGSLKKDNTTPRYGSLRKDNSTTGYGSLRKDENMTGYGGLRKDENMTGYGGLRKDESMTGYGGLRKDENMTGYGGLRKDESMTGYGGLRKNENMTGYGVPKKDENIKGYGGVGKDNSNNFMNMQNTRDVINDDSSKPPYPERLSRTSINDISEANNPIMPINDAPNGMLGDFENNINEGQNKQNEDKVGNGTNTPYESSVMNFTKQQHFGTIDKDKDQDDLYDLSGIRRDKKGAQKLDKKYGKDNITCPKCGSAFVSTKRGQGIFGTGKVKYVCEACKNKF